MSMLANFKHPKLPYQVVFEDDGRVAYAYLLAHKDIIGDVWLYNNAPAPTQPEWLIAGEQLPFRNPVGYIKSEAIEPVEIDNDVTVRWNDSADGRSLERAVLFIRGEPFAILAPGIKPGWSKLAKRDSPLAKVITPQILMTLANDSDR